MVGISVRFILAAFLIPSLSFAQITVQPAPETKQTTKKSLEKESKSKKANEKKAAPAKAGSNVLLEGWYKVLSGGVQVGYYVQRYEFDQKKKEFVNTYYLRTNPVGGSVTESLKARADSGLKPIEFQYTELVGGKAKLIEAKFKGDNMTAIITEPGKQPVTVRKTIPKGTFLSSFLVYMMLSAKEGISVGARYGYNAIAEEDGGVYPGEATIVANETTNGIPGLKVFNKFKEVQFVSFITPKGEALSTRSPTQGLATELVANMQEAVNSQSFTPSQVTSLFGELPAGKINPVAMKAAEKPVALPSEEIEKTTTSAKLETKEKEKSTEEEKPVQVKDKKAEIKAETKTEAPPEMKK